jgi:hypothetical protein
VLPGVRDAIGPGGAFAEQGSEVASAATRTHAETTFNTPS